MVFDLKILQHRSSQFIFIILVLPLILIFISPFNIFSNEYFLKKLKTVYDSSSSVQATKEILKSQKAKTFITISDYLPSVKGIGEVWQHNDELITGQFKEQEYILEGKVTQSIIDINRITNIIEAKKNLLVEIENIRIERQNILREFITKWINYCHLKKLYDLSSFADSLASKHLQATEKRFESGDLTRTDIYQAQSRYFNYRSQLYSDSISFIQASINFHIEFGDLHIDSILIPSISEISWSKLELDSLISNIPDLIIHKEILSISKSKLINNTTKSIPKLNAVAEISRNWDRSINYKPYPYNDLSIGLELSMTLWESGKNVANIISSNAIKKDQIYKLNKLQRDKRVFIQDLLLLINKYKNQLKIFRLSTESAEKSLKGTTIEFNIGTRNTMEVMETQSDLIDKKIKYEKSRKILFLTYIDLFYSLGILNFETLKHFIIQEES